MSEHRLDTKMCRVSNCKMENTKFPVWLKERKRASSGREQQCVTQERPWWVCWPRGYGHTQIFVAFSLHETRHRLFWERETGINLTLLTGSSSSIHDQHYRTTQENCLKNGRDKEQKMGDVRLCRHSGMFASCVSFPNKHRSAALSSLPQGTNTPPGAHSTPSIQLQHCLITRNFSSVWMFCFTNASCNVWNTWTVKFYSYVSNKSLN